MSWELRPGFGLHAFHDRAIHADAQAAARIAALLVDPRWPWQPSLVRPEQLWGTAVYPWPKGKVPHTRLAKTVEEILRSDLTAGLTLISSRKDDTNHAFANVQSGQASADPHPEGTACRFEARLFCRVAPALDGWIEVLHELVELLASPHAVIFAKPDERHIFSLLYGTGSQRSDQAPSHPHNENARVSHARRELGARWIRPAEWGTYLSATHVTQIGRDKLVAAAATSRDIGGLLYLQCSATTADAFGPEAEKRRQALRALLAPITIP